MRVLQLVSTLAIGGAERIVLSLAREAAGTELDLHVVSIASAGTGGLERQFVELDVPPFHLGARGLVDAFALSRLVQYVRGHRIDVIHTHLLYADVYGRLASLATEVPCVSTLHNVPAAFEAEPFHRRLAERVTARRLCHRIVTLSATVGRAYIDSWGLRPDRVTVIPNAVRLEPWIRIPPPPTSHAPTIITVGALTKQKAQHVLLEAVARLASDWPAVRLVVVGAGPRERELKQTSRDLGIYDRTLFTGSRDDVPDLLATAHVFALSSAWEGMPVSAIEAMAAGRPVVLTDVGANAELVRDGHDGLLVPPGDAASLERALDRLLRDKALSETLASRARDRACEEHGMPMFRERHDRLYREVSMECRSGRSRRSRGRSASRT